MKKGFSLPLGVVVALSACQRLPSTATVTRHTGTVALPTSAADVTVLKPGGQKGAPSATPSATSTPFHVFDPSLPSSAIAGTLQMDASYFVSSGVIAAGGANVINAGGANVIAAGGGNVIAAGGANVIAAGGANVIAAGGANVIAAGGANVIAAGGANVIAAGGANYRLLDLGAGTGASASGTTQIVDPTTIAYGTVLPAAGMLVVPVSLVTNTQIGDAVLSDAQGNFTVKIPQSDAGTIRLLAAVPGKTGNEPWLSDSRMQYTLLSAAGRSVAQNAIDEDTAVVSSYVIQSFEARFQQALQTGLTGMLDTFSKNNADPAFQQALPLIDLTAKPLVDVFTQIQGENLTAAQRLKIAQRCTGLILSSPDFQLSAILGATYTNKNAPSKIPTDQPGNPPTAGYVFMYEMREFREAAAKVLAADPGYFDNKPYITAAHMPLGKNGHVFAKATDLPDFLVSQYMSSNDPHATQQLNPVGADLAANPVAQYTDTQPSEEADGAGNAIAQAFFTKLLLDKNILQPIVQELQADAQNPPS